MSTQEVQTDFAVNYVCASASFEPGVVLPRIEGLKFIDEFRRQAEGIEKSPSIVQAWEEIQRVGRKYGAVNDLKVINLPKVLRPFKTADIADSAKALEATDIIADERGYHGWVRPFQMKWDVGDVEWKLSAKPMFTASALHLPTEASRLWWQFIGTPYKRDVRVVPTREQQVEFMRITNEMGEQAIPHLFNAYRSKLPSNFLPIQNAFHLNQARARVSLVEDNMGPAAILLNDLHARHIKISDIQRLNQDDESRRALKDFETLVSGVTGGKISVNDQTIQVHTEVPKVQGILYQEETVQPVPEIRMVGFGRFNTDKPLKDPILLNSGALRLGERIVIRQMAATRENGFHLTV